MKIYCSPHSNQKRELAFFKIVLAAFPEASPIEKPYRIAPEICQFTLCRNTLAAAVEHDNLLSGSKRAALLHSFRGLPASIRVWGSRPVSCDLTVECDQGVFFYEFHEEQHRSLSVKRIESVYSSDGDKIEVPRFVQRFLRDCWRLMYLPNITFVWFDWFKQHEAAFKPILRPGHHEYYLEERFSFKGLLGPLRAR